MQIPLYLTGKFLQKKFFVSFFDYFFLLLLGKKFVS